MTDKTIKYTVMADINPFEAGMKQIQRVFQDTSAKFGATGQQFKNVGDGISAQARLLTDNMRSNMSSMAGSFSGVVDSIGLTRAGMIGLVAAASGFAASKFVQSSAEMTETSMDFARALGVTTNQVSAYRSAFADEGEFQEFIGAAQGMTKQLRSNEDAMQAMGLATRDAAGNFRPLNELVVDGIEMLKGYKEGADRGLAAQELFGKKLDSSSRLMLINNEMFEDGEDKARKFGLQVGANAVAAFKEFDAASDDASLGLRGIGNTIGQILMPVLTDLVRLFNSIIPAAIAVVRGALGGLVSSFHLVKNGVVVVWETINAMVVTVAEPIRALGEAVGRAVTGDFRGAAEAIRGIGSTISGAWAGAMDNMAASSQKTRDRISAIFSEDAVAGIAGISGGDKNFVGEKKKEKAAKDPAEQSMMSVYEERLAQEKRFVVQQDALRDYTKQQEVLYWQDLLLNADVNAKDRLTISKKVADLEVQVWREQAKQQQGLRLEQAKENEDRALAAIEAARQEAQAQVDLGLINKQQLLEQERLFEEQKAEIRRAYLQAKLAEIDPERDPVQYEQVNNQMLELHRQYLLRKRQIEIEMQQQSPAQNIFKGMQDSFQGALTSMLSGQQKFGTAMSSLWQGIRASVAGEISKIIAARVSAFARERLLALAQVQTNAVTAGSGAAASQASIPYIGPILAAAAMATMLATVGGLAGSIPSAEGGWRIPSGVNPIAQLHENEMVLPAEDSAVIKAMADGGMGGGNVTVNLSGASAGDFFIAHKRELANAIQVAIREGHNLRRG